LASAPEKTGLAILQQSLLGLMDLVIWDVVALLAFAFLCLHGCKKWQNDLAMMRSWRVL
jgi:hypothetical protein